MRTYTINECIKYGNIHLVKHSSINTEPMHTHEFIEIVYILSGKVEQTINGQIHEVKRSDVLFMNTDCTHSFDSDSKYSYINILFSPHIVSDTKSSAHSIFSFFFLSTFNEICSEANFGKISFDEKETEEIEFIVHILNKPTELSSVGLYRLVV